MRTLRPRLALCVLVAVAASACPSRGDEVASDESATTDSSAETTGDADAGGATDTGAGDDCTGDDCEAGGVVVDDDLIEFCQVALEHFARSDAVNRSALFDPVVLEAFLVEDLPALEEAAGLAPDSLEKSLDIVLESTARLVTDLAEVRYDFAALSAAQLERLNDPAVEEANAMVNDFIDDECGGSDAAEPGTETVDDAGFTDEQLVALFEESEAFREMSARQAAPDLGITEDESVCLFDNIDFELFAEFQGGEPGAAATDDLVAAAEACDLDASRVFGTEDP